ncbi:MAG: SirB2 family protein [Hydrogenophilaceae bacterium]|nr:SirB2 family protein [Hydrogenophilaceae bacterium]
MDFLALRNLHLLTIAVSLGLFLLRGYWMLRESPRLQDKWVKIVPHANDTVLLAAAIGMLVVAEVNPLNQPWLLAKIVGLLAYIGLGTVALKRGKTRAVRIKALIAALAVFAYIVAVAVTRQVIPGT